MDLLNTNWENYAALAKQDATDNQGMDSNFLDHCLPIFASIFWQRDSNNKILAKETLQPLFKSEIPIKTPNGNITGKNLVSLMSFVYRVNRSKFLSKSMTKEPRLGTFTPLVMYAHKLYNNIGYDEYLVEDNAWVRILLGNKMLADIVTVTKAPKLDATKVASLRELTLTYASGNKQGEVAAVTLNKMRIKAIDKDKYPVAAMYMYLQIWLANGQLRDKDAMILDPLNWGNIPDAWDAEPSTSPRTKGKKTTEDDDWGIL